MSLIENGVNPDALAVGLPTVVIYTGVFTYPVQFYGLMLDRRLLTTSEKKAQPRRKSPMNRISLSDCLLDSSDHFFVHSLFSMLMTEIPVVQALIQMVQSMYV